MRWTLTRINLCFFIILMTSCGDRSSMNGTPASQNVSAIEKPVQEVVWQGLRTADLNSENEAKMMSFFAGPLGSIPRPSNKAAKNLLQKIEEVFSLPQYAPGYPTWSGIHELHLESKGGSMPGIFWPNAASAHVIRTMGFDDDILMNEVDAKRTIEWTNSYDIYQNALKSSQDIFEIKPEDAQQRANSGILVLAAAVVDAKNRKGRVGIVAPQTAKYDAANGPLIATVMPVPGFYQHRGWKNSATSIKYFTIPEKKKEPLPSINDEAIKMAKLVKEVIGRIEYQPGYPSWNGIVNLGLPKIPGAEPGVTWCNAAAYAVVEESGYDPSPLVDVGGVGWTNADQMAKNLRYHSLNFMNGVREVDALSAQNLANKGNLVLVASEKNWANGSGHMGVVVAQRESFNPQVGPIIGQAGAENGFFTLRKWQVDWDKNPKFYLLRK